jgi:predicted adenine nucleotide alpha hydrolase (AANH) superfamily ATPase
MTKPRLLLHMCCAPCSTHVINLLRKKYAVETFFYNPNIHPRGEYRLRYLESKSFTERIGIAFHKGDYSPGEWFKKISGHEKDKEGGERCCICFQIRLEMTAKKAASEGFEYFTTTLTISPHKNADIINSIGREVASRYGVEFLEANFKKKDGFKTSVGLSRRHGLRRQSYCGCIYSIRPKK